MRAVIKEKGIAKPTNTQLKKLVDKIEEEHLAILFLYKTDKSRYGKLIIQIENDICIGRIHSQNCSLMHVIS